MPNNTQTMSFGERTFREKVGLAEEQKREIVGEGARFSRLLKQMGRSEFKQETGPQYAQVRHVAKWVRPGGSASRAFARPGLRAKAKIANPMIKPKVKPGVVEHTGLDKEDVKEMVRQRTTIGGGMMQLERAKKWTTGGLRETGQENLSYYNAPSVVQTLSGGPPTSSKSVQLKARARSRQQFGQAWQRKRDQLEQHYKSKGQKGAEAVDTLMKEYERRQQGLFGNLFGSLFDREE